MDVRGVLDHRLLLSLLLHDLRDFYDGYVNQLNMLCHPLGALMRSHRGINVMLMYMLRLSLVDVYGKKSFNFYVCC